MTPHWQTDAPSRQSQYIQVLLMGVSAFIMNTTEFVPVALLTDIANDFAISTAEAGWMLTIYAWIVAAMSLPLMLITSRIERKRLLLIIFALFIISHALSSFAWGFNILLLCRAGVALSHALFWSITAAVALRVAPEGKKAFALSVIATGTSLAMVLGVPFGRLIGQWFGWRTTFATIGGMATIIFLLQAKLLPVLPSMFRGTFRKVPELLTNPLLVRLYLLIFILFTAHYAAYSYIEPFIRQVGSISENFATLVLLIFGAAGIIGSIVFSRWGETHNTLLMIASTIAILLATLFLQSMVSSPPALIFNVILWSMSLTLLIISIQAQILIIDEHAQDMLMSMFSGIINLGIGMGALLGGYTVTTISLSSVGYVGAGVTFIALLLLIFMVRRFTALHHKL